MTPLANGRVVLWQGGSLWVLRVPAQRQKEQTDVHAHHALQITLALDGAFDLHVEGAILPGPAAAVAADVGHAFKPTGLIALLFIEPESPAGRAISRDILRGAPAVAMPPDLLGAFPGQIAAAFAQPAPNAGLLRDLGCGLTERLTGGADPPPADPRIAATLAWASDNLEDRLGIAEAADRAGLSADRMSHLFVEQTGLPFRTYLLWLRLSRAVERYAAGAALTTAAHEAGFADSAHFSRTFRRMFGVAAAELQLA